MPGSVADAFCDPRVTIGTEILFQQFMARDYQASQQVIDNASGNLGMIESVKAWWSQTGNVKLRFEQLKQTAEQTVENIIKLMVIFVLQTLIIPLLLLWVLYRVARRMLA